MHVILQRNIFIDGSRIKKGINGASVEVPEKYREYISKIKDAVIVDAPVARKDAPVVTLRDLDLARAEADATEEFANPSLVRRNAQQAKKSKEA